MQELRKQYEEQIGKKPYHGWSDDQLREKMGIEIKDIKETPREQEKPKMDKYKQLPPPIVKHLEETWGNWLNYMEVEKRPWRKDYGGEGVTIRVPEKFSTEWSRERRVRYDNRTRRPMIDGNGDQVIEEIINEDIREIPLSVGVDKVNTWLDLVKEYIISKAHRKGLKLPGLNVEYNEENQTSDDYSRALYN